MKGKLFRSLIWLFAGLAAAVLTVARLLSSRHAAPAE